jgi:hypothetical protein
MTLTVDGQSVTVNGGPTGPWTGIFIQCVDNNYNPVEYDFTLTCTNGTFFSKHNWWRRRLQCQSFYNKCQMLGTKHLY